MTRTLLSKEVSPMRTLSALLVVLLLAIAAPAPAADPAAMTEDQKTAYALGLTIALSLQNYRLSPDEVLLVKQGLSDGLAGGPLAVDAAQYRPKIVQLGQDRARLVAADEKKEAAVFLERMGKEKGAEKSASGLVYIPLKAGTGEAPKATDTVKVHYHGTLRDGSVFDSSVDRGKPATFPLKGVIPCWTEGLQKMKPGGKAKLVCPPEIAYGDRGAPPKIKPGAALVFEVELLSVESPATPARPAGQK
jgi:FKBP-type peptidyl-prolyl cis-trans isomerase